MTKERNAGGLATAARWSARSLVLSLLLGMERPRMRGADLVRWCRRFGIPEGTVRVALSRMVDRGELAAANGTYELVGRVRARQSDQEFSVRPARRDWDGSWALVVAREGARAAPERAALRDAMRVLRYAGMRDGVWTRPANLDEAVAPDAAAVVAQQCDRWTAHPSEESRALAARLFAPDAWAAVAHEHLAALSVHVDGGIDERDLADAFLAGATALRHLRQDPVLPAALVAPDHPADALRLAYRSFQEQFAIAVAEWFRHARTT